MRSLINRISNLAKHVTQTAIDLLYPPTLTNNLNQKILIAAKGGDNSEEMQKLSNRD